MQKTAMLICASALLMPGFAFAQASTQDHGMTNSNPGDSTLSTPTPPEEVRKPGQYNGRSSSDLTPVQQEKPNSTEMHKSGSDAQDAK